MLIVDIYLQKVTLSSSTDFSESQAPSELSSVSPLIT